MMIFFLVLVARFFHKPVVFLFPSQTTEKLRFEVVVTESIFVLSPFCAIVREALVSFKSIFNLTFCNNERLILFIKKSSISN